MASKVGDVGTEIIVAFKTKDCDDATIALDISDQTSLEIRFRHPDGTTMIKAAVITQAPCGLGDGTDGKASYFTELGFLNQDGGWQYEGWVVKPAGSWTTDPIPFEVEKTL